MLPNIMFHPRNCRCREHRSLCLIFPHFIQCCLCRSVHESSATPKSFSCGRDGRLHEHHQFQHPSRRPQDTTKWLLPKSQRPIVSKTEVMNVVLFIAATSSDLTTPFPRNVKANFTNNICKKDRQTFVRALALSAAQSVPCYWEGCESKMLPTNTLEGTTEFM